MPILTFTSDFGSSDHLVGVAKGQILMLNDGFNLIDITHDLIPYNFMQAAYVCKSLLSSFPPESFHLIMVNSFDNNLNHLLLVKQGDQYIGIPDNGLITMILGSKPEHVVALPIPTGTKKNIKNFIKIFIESFSNILSGLPLSKLGDTTVQIQEKHMVRPLYNHQYIEGQILVIDRFLNVVVNINEHDFEEQRKGRRFKIVLLRDAFIEKISNHYGDVPEGEKLAFFNETGFLEIAINKGYAAPLFGLGEFSSSGSQHHEKRQYYQSIKVFFE